MGNFDRIQKRDDQASKTQMTHSQLRPSSPAKAADIFQSNLTQPSTNFNFADISVLQPKLTIGKPNDPYEQEADRVASQVVQKIHTVQAATSDDRDDTVQRRAFNVNTVGFRPVQRDGGIISGAASNQFESQLNQARSGGSSLEPTLQGQLESAMGADFSSVKIHNDNQADQLSRSIQAKAFTTGNDVFFKQGEYNPSSKSGQTLIAHELTHVVQQGGAARIQTKPAFETPQVQLKPIQISSVSPGYIQRALTDQLATALDDYWTGHCKGHKRKEDQELQEIIRKLKAYEAGVQGAAVTTSSADADPKTFLQQSILSDINTWLKKHADKKQLMDDTMAYNEMQADRLMVDKLNRSSKVPEKRSTRHTAKLYAKLMEIKPQLLQYFDIAADVDESSSDQNADAQGVKIIYGLKVEKDVSLKDVDAFKLGIKQVDKLGSFTDDPAYQSLKDNLRLYHKYKSQPLNQQDLAQRQMLLQRVIDMCKLWTEKATLRIKKISQAQKQKEAEEQLIREQMAQTQLNAISQGGDPKTRKRAVNKDVLSAPKASDLADSSVHYTEAAQAECANFRAVYGYIKKFCKQAEVHANWLNETFTDLPAGPQLNDPSSVQTPDEKRAKESYHKAKEYNGNRSKLFNTVVPGIITAQVPKKGDKTKFEMQIRIPVGGSGVFMGGRLMCSAEYKADNEYKVGAEFTFQLGGTAGVAALCAEFGGYAEIQGSSPQEIGKELDYAMYRRCREGSFPEKWTNAIWGKSEADELDALVSVDAPNGDDEQAYNQAKGDLGLADKKAERRYNTSEEWAAQIEKEIWGMPDGLGDSAKDKRKKLIEKAYVETGALVAGRADYTVGASKGASGKAAIQGMEGRRYDKASIANSLSTKDAKFKADWDKQKNKGQYGPDPNFQGQGIGSPQKRKDVKAASKGKLGNKQSPKGRGIHRLWLMGDVSFGGIKAAVKLKLDFAQEAGIKFELGQAKLIKWELETQGQMTVPASFLKDKGGFGQYLFTKVILPLAASLKEMSGKSTAELKDDKAKIGAQIGSDLTHASAAVSDALTSEAKNTAETLVLSSIKPQLGKGKGNDDSFKDAGGNAVSEEIKGSIGLNVTYKTGREGKVDEIDNPKNVGALSLIKDRPQKHELNIYLKQESQLYFFDSYIKLEKGMRLFQHKKEIKAIILKDDSGNAVYGLGGHGPLRKNKGKEVEKSSTEIGGKTTKKYDKKKAKKAEAKALEDEALMQQQHAAELQQLQQLPTRPRAIDPKALKDSQAATLAMVGVGRKASGDNVDASNALKAELDKKHQKVVVIINAAETEDADIK